MIEGRIIVTIASSWDYDPTSKHHIMKILSEKNDIVWINYHGSRRPTANRTDLSAVCTALQRVARGVTRVSPSMLQLTPLVVPGATRRITKWLHRRLLIAQIRRAVHRVDPNGKRPVQVWSFAPDVPFLVNQFNEESFIYYCVDDYLHFDGFDRRSIESAEKQLIDQADLVVTTSRALHDVKSSQRRETLLMRHGVDFDHFASSWRKNLVHPEDIAGLSGPIFGFFGLIHHWVDVALLAEVARLRPHYHFVIIGESKVDVDALVSLPNVHLLGRRSYRQLPRYCTAFDAGLMFFTQTAMTRAVNPIKMYEYLAAGLPIVSTPLPEAERFGEAICFGQTPGQFAAACDLTLTADYAGRREQISRLVKSESWRTKVDQLSNAVMDRVADTGTIRSIPRNTVLSSRPAGRESSRRKIASPGV